MLGIFKRIQPEVSDFTKVERSAQFSHNVKIDSHGYVGNHVRIDRDTSIGRHNHIGEATKIGQRVSTDSHVKFGKSVYVGDMVEIGADCFFQDYARVDSGSTIHPGSLVMPSGEVVRGIMHSRSGTIDEYTYDVRITFAGNEIVYTCDDMQDAQNSANMPPHDVPCPPAITPSDYYYEIANFLFDQKLASGGFDEMISSYVLSDETPVHFLS